MKPVMRGDATVNEITKNNCKGIIDDGADQAAKELLCLVVLLVKFGGGIEIFPKRSMTFFVHDIYRDATCGTDVFFFVEKPSEALLDLLATLRVRARERVKHIVEMADHAFLLPGEGANGNVFFPCDSVSPSHLLMLAKCLADS